MGLIGKEPDITDRAGYPYAIPGDGEINAITWADAQELDTPFFEASMELYSNFCAFEVLPHGKGTMHERQSILSILRVLKAQSNIYEKWEIEQKHSKK